MFRPVRRTLALLGVTAALLAPLVVQAAPAALPPGVVGVGLGSYATTFPVGGTNARPVNNTPYVTAALSGRPIPTSDWWTSIVFKENAGNPSENLFVDPTAARVVTGAFGLAGRSGLQINQPRTPSFASPAGQPNGQFQFLIGNAVAPVDLSVGMMNGTTDALNVTAAGTLVSAFSHWGVTIEYMNGKMTTQLVQGSPFTYVTTDGSASAVVTINQTTATPPTITLPGNGTAQILINGNAYGVYGPAAASWTTDASPPALRSTLPPGQNWYAIAALPDSSMATFNAFAAYAYAWPTDTQVSWAFNQATNTVQSTYSVTTTSRQAGQTQTLMGLYRHQYINLTTPATINTPYSYTTQSGPMRVISGNSFTTSLVVGPVMPWFPVTAGNTAQLSGFADQFMALNPGNTNPGAWVPMAGNNTYGTGQGLQRTVDMVPILHQLGRTADRDAVLAFLKTQLQTYFSAESGGVAKNSLLFWYDFAGQANPAGTPNTGWGTLIGYPAGFGSDQYINDHNLTYGYFVRAAAIVGMFDPIWAQTANWGGMVEMLIRDVAEPAPAGSALFPFLRNYSPYRGHSWASGAVGYADGANQESSSESMNFAVGVYLWGIATGNTQWRDLGAFLYANESVAIDQYWFDVDNATFPSNFDYPMVANRWGDGGCYCTFFGTTPSQMFAIETLPGGNTGLYLGRRPGYVKSNYEYLVTRQGNTNWAPYFDAVWMYQSLWDPAGALAAFGTGNYIPFNADTKAHTYLFLTTMSQFGEVDYRVTANVPTYVALLTEAGVRTCMAVNTSAAPLTVTFSNGGVIPALAPGAVGTTACAGAPSPTPATGTRLTAVFKGQVPGW